MTIPSRNVRSPIASHGARFHNEVLQDLVERSAHMHIAVGEWRPIVKNICSRRVLPRFLNAFVELQTFPSGENFRLSDRQPRFHRKLRFGKVQCVLITAHREQQSLAAPLTVVKPAALIDLLRSNAERFLRAGRMGFGFSAASAMICHCHEVLSRSVRGGYVRGGRSLPSR